MKYLIFTGMMFSFSFHSLAGQFVENFNRNLEIWREFAMNDVGPGSWKIVNSELHAISRGGLTRFLVTGDDGWQDYTIEFNVNPLEKHGPGNIVITARITEVSGVACMIGDLPWPEPESKVTCLAGNFHEKFGLVLLHTAPHPFLKLDKWAHLKMSVNEDRFILWVDGKKIAETGDPFIWVVDGQDVRLKAGDLSRFPKGGGGIGITNYEAVFDRIIITGVGVPDRDGLSVKSTTKLASMWGGLKMLR